MYKWNVGFKLHVGRLKYQKKLRAEAALRRAQLVDFARLNGLDLSRGYYVREIRAEYERRGVHFCKATYSRDREALGLRVIRATVPALPDSPAAAELRARFAEFSARIVARRNSARLAKHPTPCRFNQRRAANDYLNSGIDLRARGSQAKLAKRFNHSPAMVCKIVNKILCDIERGTIKLPRNHIMSKPARRADKK